MMDYILGKSGEIAALTTAVLWAFTATFFTIAGKHIGSKWVNLFRLVLASFYLLIAHYIAYGKLLPDFSENNGWIYLAISGAIGLALGDSLLFQSFLDIGTQKSMVIMSSWPLFSTLLAYIFLNESLNYVEIYGVILIVIGICFVVSSKVEPHSEPRPLRGVFLSLGGAVCQAAGILLAKKGLNEGLSSLSGTVIRMIFAALSMIVFSIFLKALSGEKAKSLNFKGMFFAFLGSIVGPFLGVWLSLYAVGHAKVGVASA
ncbi:MAG: DMT family transporter, partial [Acidobacteria bacterium]|nr:DMT family transporter [Acidobacteriota bacterium]